MIRTLLLMFCLLVGSNALACSCMSQPADLETAVNEAYGSATSVVLAEAQSVEAVTINRGLGDDAYQLEGEITHFSSIESWKGTHGKQFYTKIITTCCMCGLSFREGEVYLLYLYGPDEDGFYSTSHCTRTSRLEGAEDDIDVLDRMELDE